MKHLKLSNKIKVLLVILISLVFQYSTKGANHILELQYKNPEVHQCSIIQTKYIDGQYIAVVNLSPIEITAEKTDKMGATQSIDANPHLMVYLPCIEIFAEKIVEVNDTSLLVFK
jgi:hypothetical protein